jgi:DnaJ-class molecular chaperone
LFHKLSYEILKDKQPRKRFDRYEMLADPKAAMSRAASDALLNGIKGVGMGVFNIGAFAVQQIVRPNDENEKRA